MTTQELSQCKKLKTFILDLIKNGQIKNADEHGPAWGKGGKYDEFADIQIWNQDKINSHWPDHWGKPADTMKMVLVFESGSFQGRKSIRLFAEKLGFDVEPITGWATGFYLN
tara:strand:+ start:550 stop:885 length:336 start_codon:yes stop_codon:yes gene_type:complete